MHRLPHRKKATLLAASALLATTLLWAVEGMACGQLGVTSTEEAYKSASNIFLGKVIKRNDLYRNEKTGDLVSERPDSYVGDQPEVYQYELENANNLKGASDKTEKIFTEVNSSCALPLQVGEWYLIYANLNQYHKKTYRQDRPFISSGGKTKKLNESERQLIQEILILKNMGEQNGR